MSTILFSFPCICLSHSYPLRIITSLRKTKKETARETLPNNITSEVCFSCLLVRFDVPSNFVQVSGPDLIAYAQEGEKKRHACFCIIIVSNNEFGGVLNIV